MRIAITNWTARRVGGTEAYLGEVMPELRRAGHEIAFWHETDRPTSRARILLPEGTQSWSVAAGGERRALALLADWAPDVIYGHGLLSPRREARTLDIAPAVFFAHGYYGTCISGAKAFKRPVVQPCARRFGWRCLTAFYPRRCGGLSPARMLAEYGRQRRRLALLARYGAIVTHSEHMREEYLRHGFERDAVHAVSYYSEAPPVGSAGPARRPTPAPDGRAGAGAARLLFVGRMDRLKGGLTFLQALSIVRARVDQPLRVTFVGEGRERDAWRRSAAATASRDPGLTFDFPGWLEGAALEAILATSNLLVVPSLWPEPFGKVGVEAGLRGVPAVAFDVGGIREWLTDGENGYLVPGDPPTAVGLADGIVKFLSDDAARARLTDGARVVALRFQVRHHVTRLERILEDVAKRQPAAAATLGGSTR
jgi:glycosyltransferase involved in cell wall biosynthesis